MKPIDPGCARQFANCLTEQNAAGASWRALGREYGVAAGTLNRIAKSGGEWLPKSRKILKALGLIEPKPPEPEHTRRVKRKIAGAAKVTKEAVLFGRLPEEEYPAVKR